MDRLDAEIIVALARNAMNISRAADVLQYHRNSIDYHLNKIRKSTGLDPRNFFDLGELYSIAIKVLEEEVSEVGYTETIRVKYFVEDLEPLEKFDVGDWIDLRAGETVSLKAGEDKIIRLGVGMILPQGYEALVLPRSSTPSKFGIVCANSMGVIDNSYNGDSDEWRFPARAIRDTVINKGDRIAQFRIIENQPRIIFETVDTLNENSRGGIGSTGKR